ncbi:hypothetical protein ANO14919_073090 [Xylariales sp. No.14919]|nr:hypothetical protein ANO14919_073090 [Xylariales sp. No.14919]
MASVSPNKDPVAIVGLACRLPGGNHSPTALWDFLEDGRIADNSVPPSRFNLSGHYDGSHKPGSMRPPGGMFLDASVDLARFDAGFFEISGTEAIAMDPNQRQMLEVVYECLENAGFSLEAIDGRPIACFVGSFACDYGDAQNRDPENRPANNAVGVGRTIMANRISYFLNIKGPSVTIDTACSGSLVSLDLACQTLESGDVDAAIVATSNLYLSPEHVIDMGSGVQAHSISGFCHTFDAAADGYIKAEAVSCLIIKKLQHAIRDKDPIRAVIRGLTSNSNGRTIGGIASPSAQAQTEAIRGAYANAKIDSLNDTQYLECHGTGTQAGDVTEVLGIGAAFASTRSPNSPLIIGSIKSNVGHSEPAAGISGLIKTVLAIEKGIIPGTPSFINPNPEIDFAGSKVKVTRFSIPWPDVPGKPRRASLNSFGYGGSNAHAVIEEAPSGKSHVHSFLSTEDALSVSYESRERHRPYTLVVSANDPDSLGANIRALCNYVVNPRVRVALPDLAFTLSEKRSKLWHRAFVTTRHQDNVRLSDFVTGKRQSPGPNVGFIFTGQGSQWPAMGKELLELFPLARGIIEELDEVLQTLDSTEYDLRPRWSLLRELAEPRSADHVRQPEYSQPLITALQICLVAVLDSWGIKPSVVIGHSSGEIAAAHAAGYLDRAEAIKVAYYRGRTVTSISDMRQERHESHQPEFGMLAVGMDAKSTESILERTAYMGHAWIACFNSPSSVTVAGRRAALEELAEELKSAGHFARLLQVDLAYHTKFMSTAGDEYERVLISDNSFGAKRKQSLPTATMISTITALELDRAAGFDAKYWKTNLVSPVRFHEAFDAMMEQPETKRPGFLVEIGPTGALAGPVSQILKSHPSTSGAGVPYCAAWSRSSTHASKSLYDTAGSLFIAGAPINLNAVNAYASASQPPHTIVDLPNYSWNHSNKYWHESDASRDWRFRRFVTHDLIGSRVLGVPWQGQACVWRKHLRLDDVPWLRDHKMGPNVLMPGAGLATMAIEAMFQRFSAVYPDKGVCSPNELAYRLRDVRFDRGLVIEETKTVTIVVSLTEVRKDWHRFCISTSHGESAHMVNHCSGLIRVVEPVNTMLSGAHVDLSPLRHPQSFSLWYKAQREIGMHFGPAFRKITALEAVAGQRSCRALVDLTPPASRWDPQSLYSPFHPAVLDGCLLVATPAKVSNERSLVRDLVVPGILDEVYVNKVPHNISQGLSIAQSRLTGSGRPDKANGIASDLSVYDLETGALLVEIKGLHDVELDVGKQIDPPKFACVQWKPDISLLTPLQVGELALGSTKQVSPSLEDIIDLIAFKKPDAKVLEVNLSSGDLSSLWLGSDETSLRKSRSRLDMASPEVQMLAAMKSRHEHKGYENTSFFLVNPEEHAFGMRDQVVYDLIIVKSSLEDDLDMKKVLQNLGPCVRYNIPNTMLVSLDGGAMGRAMEQVESRLENGTSRTTTWLIFPTLLSERDPSARLTRFATEEFVEKTVPGCSEDDGTRKRRRLDQSENILSFSPVAALEKEACIATIQPRRYRNSGIPSDSRARLESIDSEPALQYWNLLISSISGDPQNSSTPDDGSVSPFPLLPSSFRSKLQSSRWNIMNYQQLPSSLGSATTQQNNSAILVLDELIQRPVLANPSEAEWGHLKALVTSGLPLLWITQGSQHQSVTNPHGALVHGLFRVVRREDPAVKLTTLDLESVGSGDNYFQSSETEDAILRVLEAIRNGRAEGEYAERKGVLHIQRIMPDVQIKQLIHTNSVVRGLWEGEGIMQLRAERVGSLDLGWYEVQVPETDLKTGWIEVEVEAVGVNFKDVATTMGIIPGNEYMLGCECSGIVRRLGPGVTKFRVGDRVAVMCAGSYTSRLFTHADRANAIQDWMSFEEAATIPLVFITALYSMFHLGNIQEGQSILIHSAAGGVGLAAIQLARYRKANIFVTVGTEEKRKFLSDTFNIPPSRIYSSRNSSFHREIMAATSGRGIDFVLNSLTGELLDLSWRLVADGGTMVEIGKRDIVERNTLAMEPFGRNCSIHAVDMSYTKTITDALIGQLLAEVFGLLSQGHIRPIQPITRYGFDKVPDALAYMRRGQHIGKLVITKSGQRDVQVPIRRAPGALILRSDVAYLLVGGLKGICGSIAIHMARCGARHIIVCNRSGIKDETSARVVRGCFSYDCKVSEAKGDITNMDFVRRIFKLPHPRHIAGIVQGAMVLKDIPFETMSAEDYRTVLEPKVIGTWNLHQASISLGNPPLEFFTLLSSLSGVSGNKGQANYAAAGTFLDAFAYYRHTLNLRAHTIDLGVVHDVGYIAEQGAARGLEERFEKGQWTPLNESALSRVFDISILQQQEQSYGNGQDMPLSRASIAQLVTGINIPLDISSELAADARFGHIVDTRALKQTGDDQQTPDDANDIALLELRALYSSQGTVSRQLLLQAYIRVLATQVVRLLRLETEIESAKPLAAYGLDSLSAVELRGWLRARLSAELSALDITNAPSLAALAEKVMERLPTTGPAEIMERPKG